MSRRRCANLSRHVSWYDSCTLTRVHTNKPRGELGPDIVGGTDQTRLGQSTSKERQLPQTNWADTPFHPPAIELDPFSHTHTARRASGNILIENNGRAPWRRLVSLGRVEPNSQAPMPKQRTTCWDTAWLHVVSPSTGWISLQVDGFRLAGEL